VIQLVAVLVVVGAVLSVGATRYFWVVYNEDRSGLALSLAITVTVSTIAALALAFAAVAFLLDLDDLQLVLTPVRIAAILALEYAPLIIAWYVRSIRGQ